MERGPIQRGERALAWCAVLTLAFADLGAEAAQAQKQPQEQAPKQEDAYPLDGYSRSISARGPVDCPRVDIVTYRGHVIRYAGAIRVHRAFRKRLRLFEKVVAETAIEFYGRKPRRVVHKGGWHCRRIRRIPSMLSEHGLGNAIDLAGFDFSRAPRRAQLPWGMPRALKRAFKVRVLSHWNGTGRIGGRHSDFLRTLARRLIARPDIFRVLLGPAWPGHRDHFHFDCAPYRLVAVFD